jgi:hypothetical protein
MILEFSRIDTLEGVTRTWICGNRRIVAGTVSTAKYRGATKQ